ncbi:MAG: hypothetical protein Q8R06_17105 [Polaromonas sp.]|uniref:glycine-rich domain-containing protein n=1 Tax=Polaromonas sp. TaxID=1869339 RepID=UPI0027345436|nr:hypothetical protein [Polaromonas sp.]MDP3798836.1 hypothetical protein [Polaromonas sp.]
MENSVSFRSESEGPITLRERIERAESFDMKAVTARFQKKTGTDPERTKLLEVELKRYLIMCAENQNESFGISHHVDELWHTFILFTKDYFKFCKYVCGGYIHHAPLEGRREMTATDAAALYKKAYETYTRTFGFVPPTDLWPITTENTKSSGGCGGLQECTGGPPYEPPCCDSHTGG